MSVIGQILDLALMIYLILLIARLVVDWVQVFARGWEPRGVLLVILEGVYTATDPPLRALRRVIPPLRLGGIALDLSFIVLIIMVYIARSMVRAIFGV